MMPKHSGSQNSFVIEASGLSKKFEEEFAVREVSFQLEKGKILAFIGPSGSGKTTTVRLLTGYHTPTSGEVKVLGFPPVEFDRSARRKIGYMPQLFALYPNLTVWQNLNFSASLYGLGLLSRMRLRKLLDFVELREHRNKKASKISGGMLRRLSLAAAIVHRPELLFLDEPTAGVDPVLRRKFWDYFRELHSEGKTLVITTQYVAEASHCDLVGVLVKGRLLLVDTPEGLQKRAYGGEIVDLRPEAGVDLTELRSIHALSYVKRPARELSDGQLRLIVDNASTAVPSLVEWCSQKGIRVQSIERYNPPFDDVFYELVKKQPGGIDDRDD